MSALASTDEEEVLHDISLQILRLATSMLVGPSGSGKSTIAKLPASLGCQFGVLWWLECYASFLRPYSHGVA